MKCANYGCVRPMIIIKFQPKVSILTGSNNPFSIKPAAARLKISGKKTSIFPVWSLLTTGYQTERNLFWHQKNTSKLWCTWSLGLQALYFLSYLQFSKVSEMITSGKKMTFDATRGISRWSNPLNWFYK